MKQTLISATAALVLVLTAIFSFATSSTNAQSEEFPFGANAAFCDPGYFGPFDGCSPWEGLTVYFESNDGTINGSCVTEAVSQDSRTGSCQFNVPYGQTIFASIDESSIPTGYYLEGAAVQEWEIPGGPPDGVFGVPAFVLLPIDTASDGELGNQSDGSVEDIQSLPNTGVGQHGDHAGYQSMMILALLALGAGIGLRETMKSALK